MTWEELLPPDAQIDDCGAPDGLTELGVLLSFFMETFSQSR